MTDQGAYRLLVDCGFKPALWGAGRGEVWRLVGELDGGFAVSVACVERRRDRFVLAVPSEAARVWLADVMAPHDLEGMELRVETTGDVRERLPWVPVAIGAGAVALFGWIVSSIAATR